MSAADASLHLHVVVTLKEGRKAEYLKQVMPLVDKSREEEGCIYYDIHVREGEEKSNRLYFIEHWRSQSDLDAHMNTDHVREFRAKTAAAVASVDFGKFKRIAH